MAAKDYWDYFFPSKKQESQATFLAKNKKGFYEWLRATEKYTREEINSLTPPKLATLNRSYRKWKAGEGKEAGKSQLYKKAISAFNFLVKEQGLEAATRWAQTNYPKTFKQFSAGKVILHGAYHNKKYFDTWANKIAGGSWTPQQIYQLQVELGFKNPTGVYDDKTKTKHWAYLQNRTESPNVAANTAALAALSGGGTQNISYLPNLRDPSHPLAMGSEQAAIENAIRQGRNERKAIQEDMFRTWKDISGVTASQANVNWATEKVLQGWGYDDFYFWMKDRPEMKQMYPGMPNGMLPSEYTGVARALNAKYMSTAGRPLTRKEIANLIKGGDFPEDDFFLGQPAIRDEEIR